MFLAWGIALKLPIAILPLTLHARPIEKLDQRCIEVGLGDILCMGGWFEIVPVVRGDPLVEYPDVAPTATRALKGSPCSLRKSTTTNLVLVLPLL